MSRASCPGCASPMARNGTRRVGFLDLGEAGAVRTEAVLRRYACRSCGLHDEDDGPVLRSGFRMTPALFDRIGAEAALSSMSDVAARHGIDRSTVRNVWTAWIRGRRAGTSRPKDSILRGVGSGSSALFAANSEGRLLTTFSAGRDPRLRNWLAGSDSSVDAEVDLVRVVETLDLPDLRMSVRRVDAAEWVESRMPAVLHKAASWFDREERRALARCREVILVPHVARTDTDDDLLASVFSACRRLREIETGVSALRRIFATADPIVARDRFVAWSTPGTAFADDVFRDVASGLDRIADRLFTPDYSRRDGLFPHRKLRLPPDSGADDADRFAGRLLALNHDAIAPRILDLDLGEPSVLVPEVRREAEAHHDGDETSVRLSSLFRIS